MRLGFKSKFEDNELLCEHYFILTNIFGEGLQIDYFTNEGFIFLIEVSLDLFLVFDE